MSQNSSDYHVLVVLTSNDLCDLGPTVDEIVRASSLPLSIVLVGVGSDNLTKVQKLDAGPDKPLYSHKTQQHQEREIV